MEKLTLRLIKNKNNELEYSVLEQSNGIKRGDFDHSIPVGSRALKVGSMYCPELNYMGYTFWVKGTSKEDDEFVHIFKISEYVESFLNHITKENIQKLKTTLAPKGIDFKLVTNLYNKNVNSRF